MATQQQLFKEAVKQLNSAGKINPNLLNILSNKSSMFIDQLTQRLNNIALSEMTHNGTTNQANPAIDPNSPMAIMMALQNTNGDRLIHILQASLQATLDQMNNDSQAETDRENNQTLMLDATAEGQYEALQTAAIEQTQELENQSAPSPSPKPGHSASKDEEELLKKVEHKLAKHEAKKEVEKLATHGLEDLAKTATHDLSRTLTPIPTPSNIPELRRG